LLSICLSDEEIKDEKGMYSRRKFCWKFSFLNCLVKIFYRTVWSSLPERDKFRWWTYLKKVHML